LHQTLYLRINGRQKIKHFYQAAATAVEKINVDNCLEIFCLKSTIGKIHI